MGAVPGNQDQHVFIKREQNRLGILPLRHNQPEHVCLNKVLNANLSVQTKVQGEEKGLRSGPQHRPFLT
jgi:hypothetical protein